MTLEEAEYHKLLEQIAYLKAELDRTRIIIAGLRWEVNRATRLNNEDLDPDT